MRLNLRVRKTFNAYPRGLKKSAERSKDSVGRGQLLLEWFTALCGQAGRRSKSKFWSEQARSALQ